MNYCVIATFISGLLMFSDADMLRLSLATLVYSIYCCLVLAMCALQECNYRKRTKSIFDNSIVGSWGI